MLLCSLIASSSSNRIIYRWSTRMRTLIKRNFELFKLCNYSALLTACNYLIATLILSAFYFGYYGITIIPFYLTLLLVLLPHVLKGLCPDCNSSGNQLTYLRGRLKYSSKKHNSYKISFYLIVALLLLWHLRWTTLPQIGLWMRRIPTILIISSLLIYTIGQYYYFLKFHKALMSNSLESI